MADESVLSTARLIAQARLALDDALGALILALPEDERGEFEESDVEGFAFQVGGAQLSKFQLASRLGRGGLGASPVAFFDTNNHGCGAGLSPGGLASTPGG